jgi:putative membrane protein
MFFLVLLAILAFWWASGHWGSGPGFGFFPFWPLLLLLFFFSCGRHFSRGGHRERHHRHQAPSWTAPQDPALTTLRERFARGEIEEDEYLRSLEILRGGGLPDGGATAPRDPARPSNGGDDVG